MRAWSSGSHDRDLPMNIRVSPRNGDQKRVGGFERVVETGKPSVFEVDTSLWWPGKTLNLGICPDREARLWGGTRYPASVSRLAAFGATWSLPRTPAKVSSPSHLRTLA